MLRRTDGAIIGVGRLRLAYRTWEAARARAALVVIHGLGEHSGRYEELAQRIGGFGFSTYALDLRGHGLSEGRRGHTPTFDAFLQDVDRFRREVEGLADLGVPLFLLGHSFGGLIVLRYIEEYSNVCRGAIVSSPWLATALPVPRWKATAARFLARLLPAFPMRNEIDPATLTRDDAIVSAYRADPLVHDRITPRLFTEVSANMGLVLQRSDRIADPILFLLAGDDHIVDTQRSIQLARSMTAADVTIRTFPGHYHEVLNELDRARTRREIRDWIAARLD